MLAARLEAARSRADASRAREEYDRSQRVYSRQQMLNREGATPRLHYEKAEKDYLHAQTEFNSLDQLAKQAEERVSGLIESLEGVRKQIQEKNDELEVATAELQAADVHAPINGVIVARQGAEGIEVTRSTRDLFQIASDLSRLEVVVEPDPKQRGLIREGQEALVQVAELSDQSFPAKVNAVEESRVLVVFANPLTAIKPGIAAQVRIRVRD
jgi:multidrug resistance efflux pump